MTSNCRYFSFIFISYFAIFSQIRKSSSYSNGFHNGTQSNGSLNGVNISNMNISSRSSTEDLRALNLQKQRRIEKLNARVNPPDFNVYFERNSMVIKEQFGSEITEDLVREYLHKVWLEMPENEKQKYRRGYRSENSVSNWLDSEY